MLALAFDGQERPVIIKHVADAALHRQNIFANSDAPSVSVISTGTAFL